MENLIISGEILNAADSFLPLAPPQQESLDDFESKIDAIGKNSTDKVVVDQNPVAGFLDKMYKDFYTLKTSDLAVKDVDAGSSSAGHITNLTNPEQDIVQKDATLEDAQKTYESSHERQVFIDGKVEDLKLKTVYITIFYSALSHVKDGFMKLFSATS